MGLFFPVLKSLKMMADSKDPIQSVQTFGRKKTATAVAYCKRGKGLIRVNGKPLTEVDVRIRVKGGGRIAQVYAIRQALSKALVAYYQKFVDEQSKKAIKDL